MKKPNSWLKNRITKFSHDEAFILEGKLLELSEQICIQLEDLNWSKKDLAQKMNVSQAFVTKLLNGKNNYTLKTLVKVAKTINLNINIRFEKEDEQKESLQESSSSWLVSDEIIECENNNPIWIPDGNILSIQRMSNELINLNLKSNKTCRELN